MGQKFHKFFTYINSFNPWSYVNSVLLLGYMQMRKIFLFIYCCSVPVVPPFSPLLTPTPPPTATVNPPNSLCL